jgi:hypothetical protein
MLGPLRSSLSVVLPTDFEAAMIDCIFVPKRGVEEFW